MSSYNWERHWRETDEPERARAFSIKMAQKIHDFIMDRAIQTVGDYGCGPGTFLFELASSFPERQFFGYDISNAIIEKNRRMTEINHIKNLIFEVDTLPYPLEKRKFDLLTCFATLHYLEEIEAAIANMFEMVKPGGYLIFNYPNVYTMKQYQKDIKLDDENLRNRFSLVLAGKNLLSYRKIGDVLGIAPRKFYSSMKGNIYVSIFKDTKV